MQWKNLLLAGYIVAWGFPAFGQCKVEAQATESTRAGVDNARVDVALASSDQFWGFITAPETPYFEREEAISKGWKLISPDWIPRLGSARGELLREWQLHQFGVALSRLDAAPGRYPADPRARVGTAINRTILGHRFTVPPCKIEHPGSPEERAKAPWAYQVFYLVLGLYDRVVRETPTAALDRIVLSLPCDDWETASSLVAVTLKIVQANRHVRPEIFATWENALHNQEGTPAVERATLGLMGAVARALTPTEADEDWATLQILGLDAFGMDITQREAVIYGIPFVKPLPSTLLLTAVRHTLDSKQLGLDTQASYAKALLEAVGAIPVVPHALSYDDRAKLELLVEKLQAWLAQNGGTLQQKAKAEAKTIATARETLRRASGACKAN